MPCSAYVSLSLRCRGALGDAVLRSFGCWMSPLTRMAAEQAEHERVQVQVQVGFVVEVPPTEPVVCLQQGLQHRCWTKSGNTRPPKQPLQEEAILYPSIKDPGTSVPASFYAASARTVPKNSKTRTAHGRPGFGYKNRKKTQRLENCGARRAAFKPYFFLSFILGSRVRKPAAFSVARNSGLTLSRARATP